MSIKFYREKKNSLDAESMDDLKNLYDLLNVSWDEDDPRSMLRIVGIGFRNFNIDKFKVFSLSLFASCRIKEEDPVDGSGIYRGTLIGDNLTI